MKDTIEILIEQFNHGWINGELEVISTLLHDDALFIAPDLETEIQGIDNCLQTIKDYVQIAKTIKFEVTNKKIHIWERTAFVIMDYVVDYEMNSQAYKEKGKEYWTLTNQNGNWKMICRAIVGNEQL